MWIFWQILNFKAFITALSKNWRIWVGKNVPKFDIELSRNVLFCMKYKVCLKYFVHDFIRNPAVFLWSISFTHLASAFPNKITLIIARNWPYIVLSFYKLLKDKYCGSFNDFGHWNVDNTNCQKTRRAPNSFKMLLFFFIRNGAKKFMSH